MKTLCLQLPKISHNDSDGWCNLDIHIRLHIRQYLNISGNIWSIWQYLRISDSIWTYLGISRHIWQYLTISGHIWAIRQYLVIFNHTWTYLAISKHTWPHLYYLAIADHILHSFAIWAYPAISNYIRPPFGLSGNVWSYLIPCLTISGHIWPYLDDLAVSCHIWTIWLCLGISGNI